ncbi:MAG TPA: P-loop NTPase, partial [Candidatus Polarisedimenticolia bacterium]|nr:P-loop NTPase [Candidatus Polarisedimenticolia bacterium]
MMDPAPHPPGDAPAGESASRTPEGPPARQAIWTLAGGKGGVGRSLLAANLGVQLARAGRRVVLVDLDLQGGNLHAYLGFQRL